MRTVVSLRDVLSAQGGLVHHDQLVRLGVTRMALRRRLDSGRLREVLPSVYASFDCRPSSWQRSIAAWLYAGRGAVLTGRVALRWHGVRNLPADPYVRVLVPHARQVRSVEFVRVHRTRRPDPFPANAAPIRVCSLGRAVADAARWSRDLPMIRALVGEVVQGLGVEPLRRELALGPCAGSGLLRLALDEVAPAPAGALEQYRSDRLG
ncbi:type IV toxin-antitoxin system AbiEi family antitoxin domain-containing protein [Planosporangium flavigriseum]|uniref:AbiEi antitoxin N-terminal domain-containing protein n=1 Tax=Planosporangium flavigriseum TaxID=373681 RepID=A0A8J3LQ64_9ACTN|nr:type IV toxin-antitoxin system AbiEi family antitoxin domain-containing protein [Planosporangium flavigriseum]NJC63443.1 type IV toxin-antitoxin system AbiEi family antitoxin domain-containing protein [Planosporangium flavigriseum]GIG76797.1 hypothetical protein Pfl04_52010 [Planosporangium flavigriseum]